MDEKFPKDPWPESSLLYSWSPSRSSWVTSSNLQQGGQRLEFKVVHTNKCNGFRIFYQDWIINTELLYSKTWKAFTDCSKD